MKPVYKTITLQGSNVKKLSCKGILDDLSVHQRPLSWSSFALLDIWIRVLCIALGPSGRAELIPRADGIAEWTEATQAKKEMRGGKPRQKDSVCVVLEHRCSFLHCQVQPAANLYTTFIDALLAAPGWLSGDQLFVSICLPLVSV